MAIIELKCPYCGAIHLYKICGDEGSSHESLKRQRNSTLFCKTFVFHCQIDAEQGCDSDFVVYIDMSIKTSTYKIDFREDSQL